MRYILLLLILLSFNACELEEDITIREYPFIKLLGVSSLDDTGVTVSFEILKEGKLPISSYGVEYSREQGSQRFGLFSVENGKPTSKTVQMRLDKDLIAGEAYICRPFVRAGKLSIYGEETTFTSRGGKAPVVNSISTTILSGTTDFSIKGDFFSTIPNGNIVEIIGLEEHYSTYVISSSHTELQVRATRTHRSFSGGTNKYNVKITSNNKSITVFNQFTVSNPLIEEVSPLKGHAGSAIEMKINFGSSESQNPEINMWVARFQPNGSNGMYSGRINDVSPGFYSIEYSGPGFHHIYPQQYEVLDSWKLEMTGKNGLDKMEYDAKFLVGENIVQVGRSWDKDIFLYNFISDQKTQLKSREDINPRRSNELSVIGENRYLYYGLGNRWEENVYLDLKDFKRLDIVTNQWEILADLPLALSGVRFAFDYQGKIWIVGSNYINFYFYDYNTRSWGTSPVSIPNELRTSSFQYVDGDDIYFYRNSLTHAVYKYKIGGEPVLVSVLEGVNYPSGPANMGIVKSGDILHVTAWDSHYQIDLNTSETSRVQSIYERKGDITFPFLKNGSIWAASMKYATGADGRTQIFRFDNKE